MNKVNYKFDIIPGYKCNFRCKYCFEQECEHSYIDKYMSSDVVFRTTEYIKYLLDHIEDINKFIICFFGGEPLLHFNIVEDFILKLKDNNVVFNIISNGSLFDENLKQKLLTLQEKTNNRVRFRISYDYSLQNNRKIGSYDIVRDNIRWLNNNNFDVKTISVLSLSDFNNLHDMFCDFYNLYSEIPQLRFDYNINIDRCELDFEYNLDVIKDNIRRIFSEYSFLNLKKIFFYNNSYIFRKFRLNNCFYSDIYTGIDVDGSVMPSYSSCFSPNIVRNYFKLGTVFDDFGILEKNRFLKLQSLDFALPEKCDECKIPCNIIPWDTIKTDISEFNGMPSEKHCEVHRIIYNTINER